MKSELNLELVDPGQITLEDKVATFKNDPEKLRQANQFIDELIQQARADAELKLRAKEKARIVSHLQSVDIVFIRFLSVVSTAVSEVEQYCNSSEKYISRDISMALYQKKVQESRNYFEDIMWFF